jgi:A/G-specific adenine glycosylase
MDISKPAARNHISRVLTRVIPRKKPGIFNQAVMELGAMICRPRFPNCHLCPISIRCRAFGQHRVEWYPVKSTRPAIPEYRVSVAVILKNHHFYIQKRSSRGHLGGLWEFPGGKAGADETDEQALLRECQEELGVRLEIKKKITTIGHGYSHFRIRLSFFACNLPDGESIRTSIPHKWITLGDIPDYPFPAANHKFFPLLKIHMSTIL